MSGSAVRSNFVSARRQKRIVEFAQRYADDVLRPDRFDICRRSAMSVSTTAMRGRLQKEGEIIHIICDRIVDHDAMLRRIGRTDQPLPRNGGNGRGRSGSRKLPL